MPHLDDKTMNHFITSKNGKGSLTLVFHEGYSIIGGYKVNTL